MALHMEVIAKGSAPIIMAFLRASIGVLSPVAQSKVPMKAERVAPQSIRCLMPES